MARLCTNTVQCTLNRGKGRLCPFSRAARLVSSKNGPFSDNPGTCPEDYASEIEVARQKGICLETITETETLVLLLQNHNMLGMIQEFDDLPVKKMV
jgi:hypothetical protein